MAATVSWRDIINSHPLAKRLKRNNVKDSLHKQHIDAKNLICVHGGDLYVWDASDGHILHCNLKTLLCHDTHDTDTDSTRPTDSTTNNSNIQHNSNSYSKGTNGAQEETLKYQKLLVGDGFTIDAEGLSINRCSSHLVVWSLHGIRVVELPRRWGKNAAFEGGKDIVTCRTICIAERTFSGSHSLRVRQVCWHPGSKTDTHLALLTSDNIFSVYDIQQPDQPLSTININTDLSATYSPTRSVVSVALGDSCVAFDFGQPFILQPKRKTLQGVNKADSIEVWPVYCVRGSGEIMLIYSHLSQFSLVTLPVQGPLVMCPSAEDNYGVDACSVLCLATPLPVIVISTCEGRIHHCMQLPGSLDNESLQSDVSNVKHPVSSSSSLYEPIPEPVLYVVETAELELCLSVPDETSVEDDFMCPVRLKKDIGCFDRYHCAHAAGVHSVALPWLNAVDQYLMDESKEFNMPEEKQCIVEHLLCTKPLFSCPTSPVLGVDVISDTMLGPTLLILSSDYEFTALPIGLQYRLSSFHQRDDADTDSKQLSPFKHHSREPFSKQVEQILQKRASNPLLKSGNGAELSQQDCFQLLSRATQTLREEYIQKQDHARQELDTRIDILKEHKEHQLLDLKRLLDSRHMLREHARTIAERLEASKDNHENLLKRLQSVLRKIQSRVPVLSEAEKHMFKELIKIKNNMQLYTDSIEQIRVKQQYQNRQLAKTSIAEVPVLHKKQLAQIHDVLTDEAEDIEKLKCDINRLNIAFN